MNFNISDEEVDPETHVIALGGEVDLYTAPEFKERMVKVIEEGKKRVVVDLSDATFIDSTTLVLPSSMISAIRSLNSGAV